MIYRGSVTAGEESFLDLNIKVYIHYSTAQTGVLGQKNKKKMVQLFGLIYRRKSVSTPKIPSAAIFAAPPTKKMARAFIKKHNYTITLKRVHDAAPFRT